MKINFEKGLPGLEGYKDYILEEIEDNEHFKVLKSVDDKNISLVVMSPFDAEREYEIDLSDDVIDKLRIESEKDVMLLTTVTIDSNVKNITTNLRAPLIINMKNNKGEQIILNKDCYEIKHHLVKE